MKTVADKILPGNVVAFELSKTDLLLEGYSTAEVVVTMFSDSQGAFEDRLVLESDLLSPFEVRCLPKQGCISYSRSFQFSFQFAIFLSV